MKRYSVLMAATAALLAASPAVAQDHSAHGQAAASAEAADIVRDAADLPALLGPASRDAAVCHDLITQVEDPAAVLAALAGVLCDGGVLSLSFANRDWLVLRAGRRGEHAGALRLAHGPDAGRPPAPAMTLAEVEAYARSGYLAALAAGDALDAAAADRLYARVADLTGLPRDLVARNRGRIPMELFVREAQRAAGRIVSSYDATISAVDIDPSSRGARGGDPVLDASIAPFTTAFGAYVPVNFDGFTRGTVTVRQALTESLNIPAIVVLDAVGPARLVARMKRAHAKPLLPVDTAPSLAVGLGGVGVTLRDLVSIYAAIARGGSPAHCARAAVPRVDAPGVVVARAGAVRGGRLCAVLGAPAIVGEREVAHRRDARREAIGLAERGGGGFGGGGFGGRPGGGYNAGGPPGGGDRGRQRDGLGAAAARRTAAADRGARRADRAGPGRGQRECGRDVVETPPRRRAPSRARCEPRCPRLRSRCRSRPRAGSRPRVRCDGRRWRSRTGW